jgi:feruloyl esterase
MSDLKHCYEDFARLFMVPGMQHCSGGPGPDTFDSLGALEQWVEHHKAPEKMIASHLTNGVVDRTRPLCVYPQVAQYKGKGDTNDAKNFACVNPQ